VKRAGDPGAGDLQAVVTLLKVGSIHTFSIADIPIANGAAHRMSKPGTRQPAHPLIISKNGLPSDEMDTRILWGKTGKLFLETLAALLRECILAQKVSLA
jgi:hypothetical protein